MQACKQGGLAGILAQFYMGVEHVPDGAAQETPYISSNLLGNHRSWLGYAQEKAGQATNAAQSGYQAAKDKAAEF